MDDTERRLFEGARELLKQEMERIMEMAQEHGATSISGGTLARVVTAIDVIDRKLARQIAVYDHGHPMTTSDPMPLYWVR